MKIVDINGFKYGIVIGSKITQPIGDFFICSMNWVVLKEIGFNNPRMLISKGEDGTEEYRGIQRFVSEGRKKDIVEYLKSPYATFPSSIIINFPVEFLDLIPFKFEFGQAETLAAYHNDIEGKIPKDQGMDSYLLVFPIKSGVAQIIDGQHRLSAFENFDSNETFDLPVTIFMNQTLERQAELFAVINGKQTRVSPSLVFDLFGITEKSTPYKVANDLVKMLNESSVSPLKNAVKILGKANEFYKGVITQSTLAQNIIFLICGDINQAERDKTAVLKGDPLDVVPTLTKKSAPLREFFVNDEFDALFKILLNFFKAVENVFSEEWKDDATVLKKTVGISALFKYLAYLSSIGKEQGELTESFFESYLSQNKSINLQDIQLSSKGVNQIYSQLVSKD